MAAENCYVFIGVFIGLIELVAQLACYLPTWLYGNIIRQESGFHNTILFIVCSMEFKKLDHMPLRPTAGLDLSEKDENRFNPASEI